MRTVLAANAVGCAFAAASPAARLTTVTLPVSLSAASAPTSLAEERGRGRVLVAGLSVGSDYLPVTLLFTSWAYAATLRCAHAPNPGAARAAEAQLVAPVVLCGDEWNCSTETAPLVQDALRARVTPC